jgi:hypothetical protein
MKKQLSAAQKIWNKIITFMVSTNIWHSKKKIIIFVPFYFTRHFRFLCIFMEHPRIKFVTQTDDLKLCERLHVDKMYKNQKSTNHNVILNKQNRRVQFDLWFGEKKKEKRSKRLNLNAEKRKSDHSLLASFCTDFLRVVLFSESGEKKISRSETLEEETSKISEISQVLENQVKIFDEKKWKFEVGFSGIREPILRAQPNFF